MKLRCVLALAAVSAFGQTKVAPDQIRVPTAARVMVIANGSIQFAILEGVTLDTSVNPPVLRVASSAPAARVRESFITGSVNRTNFSLTAAPPAGSLVEVFVNGLLQDPADYAISGSTLVMRFALPNADDKVTVIR